MRFTFEGQEYCIVFRHDLSRKLEDHVDHEVILMQETRKRKDGREYEGGPAYLVCDTCTVKYKLREPLRLTGLNRQQLKRRTYCYIMSKEADGTDMTGDMNGIAVPNEYEGGPAYLVCDTCGTDMTGDMNGIAVPNEKAGDSFTRADGCYHALLDALTMYRGGISNLPRVFRSSEEFRKAVWNCYLGARRSKTKGVGK